MISNRIGDGRKRLIEPIMFPSSGHVKQAGLGGGEGRGQVTKMLVAIVLVLQLYILTAFWLELAKLR